MVCGPALPADTALVGARAPSRSTYVWILALPVRSSPLGGSSSAPEHRVTSDHQAERSCRAGWDYVHVAVDDASRLAPSTVHAGWHRAPCMPMKRAAARVGRSSRPSATTGASASLSSASRPRTVPATSRNALPGCSAAWASAMCAPSLCPPHQRQGRAAYPYCIARVGLCVRLRTLRPVRGPSAILAASLQLAPTSCQLARSTTRQPTPASRDRAGELTHPGPPGWPPAIRRVPAGAQNKCSIVLPDLSASALTANSRSAVAPCHCWVNQVVLGIQGHRQRGR